VSRPLTNADLSNQADAALAAFDRGEAVHLELPSGGVLQVEHRSPIMCVYRRTAGRKDAGTEELVSVEKAHFVIPAEPRRASQAQQTLRALIERLVGFFGTFLLIEIWSAPLHDHPESVAPPSDDGEAIEPRFEIVAPSSRIPRVTIEALSKSLGKEVLPFGGTRVVLGPYANLAPPGLKPLIRLSELKKWNGYLLGLVVRPVYRNEVTHELIPAAMRSISRSVQCALDHAYFSFVQQRKSLRPAHYHAPARDSVVKDVLEIDRQLADIDRSFDLLLQATPVNAESAWREFRRLRFEKPPVFFYRPIPLDPTLLKRQLYLIPVERIEDPTLSYLFRQKQEELDRQITLLSDVDTPRFLPESLQIYGGVSDWLLQHANELLDRVPTRSGGSMRGQLNATEFAQRAQLELGYYQQQCADFSASVAVRDDMYAGMMVSGGQLLIGGKTRVPRRRVDALLQHEIGTHLVTRYNGQHQPFRQLEVGLAGYDGLQEGLAVLAEYLVGGLSRYRMRVLAARVVAAHYLLEGASFIETFRILNRNLVFSQRTAYTIAMRIYRGGGLTKDAVYLRGLLQILRYLREGGQLEPLFVGKVASAHLPLIHELSNRDILKPPALKPRYLESADAQRKLDRLREGMKLLELLQL
jgi:uncharacterized protein (TIGR02421 family)